MDAPLKDWIPIDTCSNKISDKAPPFNPLHSLKRKLHSERHEMYEPESSRKGFEEYVNSSFLHKMNLKPQITVPANSLGAPKMDILDQISDLVDLSKHTINAELEVHIGSISGYTSKRFASGVSKSWFYEQLGKMISYPKWESKSKDWEKIEELVFDRDIKMRRSPGGLGTYMKKVLIKGIDIRLEDARNDIRIVLKSENKSHVTSGYPNYFRFKERMQFKHTNFIYFFTKVWEGRTLKEACESFANYEIELECDSLETDFRYVAQSMIMKCKDLVGIKTLSHEPLRTIPTEKYKPNEKRKQSPPKNEYNDRYREKSRYKQKDQRYDVRDCYRGNRDSQDYQRNTLINQSHYNQQDVRLDSRFFDNQVENRMHAKRQKTPEKFKRPLRRSDDRMEDKPEIGLPTKETSVSPIIDINFLKGVEDLYNTILVGKTKINQEIITETFPEFDKSSLYEMASFS